MTDQPAAGGAPGGPLAAAEAILISYRSGHHLRDLLPTLPPDLAVAVVDNSPGVEDLSGLVAGRPRTRLVPDGPGGFAGGANLGVRDSTAEVVIFVNPDSRPTPPTIAALVADVQADPGLAGVGPLTRGPDGLIELGVAGWRPSARRAVVHALGLHQRWPRAGLVARPEPGEDIAVDWVSGACLAVPRALFVELGGFDETYHVYSEDMAYGVLAGERGHRSLLRTDLVVPHEGGGSGAPKTYNARLMGGALALWSLHNLSRVESSVLRLALAMGMLARVPLYLATGRRARAVEAIAYVRGLRATSPPPRLQ